MSRKGKVGTGGERIEREREGRGWVPIQRKAFQRDAIQRSAFQRSRGEMGTSVSKPSFARVRDRFEMSD